MNIINLNIQQYGKENIKRADAHVRKRTLPFGGSYYCWTNILEGLNHVQRRTESERHCTLQHYRDVQGTGHPQKHAEQMAQGWAYQCHLPQGGQEESVHW